MDRWNRRGGRAQLAPAFGCLITTIGAAGGPAPDFVDDTVNAGLHYLQYEIEDPPDPRGLIYMTGGAAAGDYDGDGWVDLYVTRLFKADSLFRNMGDGTFEDVTIAAGFTDPLLNSNGAAWGDVDNDGDLDLYITTAFDTRFLLFINDGGTFTEDAVARGAAVEGPDTHYGQSVTFGDFDQDGWLDIHTTEWRRIDLNPTGAMPNARLLRNLGDASPGHFEDVTEAAGVVLDQHPSGGSFSFASRFSDLDDDGWLDLVIAADFGVSRIFWNNGDGTFTDGTVAAGVGTDENGMGSAIGDVDGDGLLDWFVTSIYDEVCEGVSCPWGTTGNRLYRNLGGRAFEDVTDAYGVRNGDWGWGACFFDYDNDADLDLVMTNGVDFLPDPRDEPYNDDPMRLWRNDGLSLTEVGAASGITDTGNGKGIVSFDYDRDGDRDLFVANNSGYPVLYRNDVATGNSWLNVETRGWANKFGVGAKVRVTVDAGGPTQIREINCGSHFLGQSEMTAHFGLGPGATPVHEVSIQWPGSSELQTFTDVPRNTTLVAQEPAPAPGLPTVVDIGLESGFQDTFLGHHNRARACVAADFDLDGWVDFYIGNPSDESFVIRNTGIGEDDVVHFELGQVLLVGEVAWGASSADYDNDGDYDLFITCGGNELNAGPCFLFRNLFLETGALAFEDVTDVAGVRGIVPPGETEPQVAGHSNAVWGDYDQDGDVDLFVNVNISGGSLPTLLGRNVLWRNDGDGTFTDVTDAVGLGASLGATQHSTFVDVDNDGDLDLYENNFGINTFFPNVLWLNLLADTGQATFVNVTSGASAPGQSLEQPKGSFVSAAGDFNNDGLEDILAFKRMCATGCETLYDTGHVLFLNGGPSGFANVADATGLNNPYWGDQGVMGSQLSDLNGDGILDVFIGNGQPLNGEVDQLYLSNATAGPVGSLPQYENVSSLIDFPAAEDGSIAYPPYPYRTHGSCCVDVDNDGVLELAVTNGGTATSPPIVREPNRLFKFTWDQPFNYLKVRPVGDGVNVSRDAIGTRISVTVRQGGGPPWTVYNTLYAGRAFSAQNGFEMYYGLAQADTIESMHIVWPDGTVRDITEGLEINTSMVVERTPTILGDIDGDGSVAFSDLSALLARWGACAPCPPACVGDLNADCSVNFTDLTMLLAQWGAGA